MEEEQGIIYRRPSDYINSQLRVSIFCSATHSCYSTEVTKNIYSESNTLQFVESLSGAYRCRFLSLKWKYSLWCGRIRMLWTIFISCDEINTLKCKVIDCLFVFLSQIKKDETVFAATKRVHRERWYWCRSGDQPAGIEREEKINP